MGGSRTTVVLRCVVCAVMFPLGPVGCSALERRLPWVSSTDVAGGDVQGTRAEVTGRKLLEVSAQRGSALFPAVWEAVLDGGVNPGRYHNVSKDCSHSLGEYSRGFHKREAWAVRMYDASGKASPGMLVGGLTLFGNYDECLNSHHYPELDQRHLTARASSPRYCSSSFTLQAWMARFFHSLEVPYPATLTRVTVDLCVPSTCTPFDLHVLLSQYLSSDVSNVTIGGVECFQHQDFLEDPAAISMVLFLSLIVVLVAVGTCLDVVLRMDEVEAVSGPVSRVGYRGGHNTSRLSRFGASFYQRWKRIGSGRGRGTEQEWEGQEGEGQLGSAKRRYTIGYKPSIMRRISSSFVGRHGPTRDSDLDPSPLSSPRDTTFTKGAARNSRQTWPPTEGGEQNSRHTWPPTEGGGQNSHKEIADHERSLPKKGPGVRGHGKPISEVGVAQLTLVTTLSDPQQLSGVSPQTKESHEPTTDTEPQLNGLGPPGARHTALGRTSPRADSSDHSAAGALPSNLPADLSVRSEQVSVTSHSSASPHGPTNESLSDRQVFRSEGSDVTSNPPERDDDTTGCDVTLPECDGPAARVAPRDDEVTAESGAEERGGGRRGSDSTGRGGTSVSDTAPEVGGSATAPGPPRATDGATSTGLVPPHTCRRTHEHTLAAAGTEAPVFPGERAPQTTGTAAPVTTSERAPETIGTTAPLFTKEPAPQTTDTTAPVSISARAPQTTGTKTKTAEAAGEHVPEASGKQSFPSTGSCPPRTEEDEVDGVSPRGLSPVLPDVFALHVPGTEPSTPTLRSARSSSPTPPPATPLPATPCPEDPLSISPDNNDHNRTRSPKQLRFHDHMNTPISATTDTTTTTSATDPRSRSLSPQHHNTSTPKRDHPHPLPSRDHPEDDLLFAPPTPGRSALISIPEEGHAGGPSGDQTLTLTLTLNQTPPTQTQTPTLHYRRCGDQRPRSWTPHHHHHHGNNNNNEDGYKEVEEGGVRWRRHQDSELWGTDVEGQVKQEEEEEEAHGLVTDVLLCFSFLRAVRKVLAEGNADHLFSLNGVRVLSISWIVLGNTMAMMHRHPHLVGNKVDTVKLAQTVWFQAVMNGTFAADTFFILSGCLVCYHFLRAKSRQLQKDPVTSVLTVRAVLLFYLHRFIRVLPCYYVVLLSYTTLVPYLGDGPHWSSTDQDLEPCRDHWWANALFFSNFYRADHMCMSWSYYLVNDIQMYLLSPVVLYPLLLKPSVGLLLLVLLVVLQMTSTAFLTSDSGGNLLSMSADFFADVYSKPYCRVGAFAVGMGLGYFLHATRRQVFFRKTPLILGWMTSLGVVGTVVYVSHAGNGEGAGQWHVTQHALYQALSRPLWCLAVAFIIFVCSVGQGGMVYRVLSWNLFLPLCRTTYGVYLLHPVLLTLLLNTARAPLAVTFTSLVYMFLSTLLCSYGLAFLLITLVESPFTALEAALRKRCV
ncbi:uncharacterized protein LOC143290596 isoform X2 [Babylonia areolata]|uniref:uncharacterized protein LOC143290596 isoform X2 n=1 Tax=Babylonia areolata TaxID=304850 RepID=UPI003FD35EC3